MTTESAKCSRCHKIYALTDYGFKRNNIRYKTCQRCRIKKVQTTATVDHPAPTTNTLSIESPSIPVGIEETENRQVPTQSSNSQTNTTSTRQHTMEEWDRILESISDTSSPQSSPCNNSNSIADDDNIADILNMSYIPVIHKSTIDALEFFNNLDLKDPDSCSKMFSLP